MASMAAKAPRRRLTADRGCVLDAPPCKAEADGALLLTPNALTGRPLPLFAAELCTVPALVVDNVVGRRLVVERTVAFAERVVNTVDVTFAVGANVDVEVAVTVKLLVVMLLVAAANAWLMDDSYRTCAELE